MNLVPKGTLVPNPLQPTEVSQAYFGDENFF